MKNILKLLVPISFMITPVYAAKDSPGSGRLLNTGKNDLKDIPLTEIRSIGDSKALAIFLSGDGGWSRIDKKIAEIMSKHNISVVGLNSLKYFRIPRNPEIAAMDMERIIRFYRKAWGVKRTILAGYSLGADVLPFIVNRLPGDIMQNIQNIILLGPGLKTSFEFHLYDWLGVSSGSYPVLPEVMKMKKMKVLCICGDKEKDSLCGRIEPGFIRIKMVKGGHHFNRDYNSIAGIIINESGLNK